MGNTCLPKQIFYGDIATGTRRQEGQKPRYKHILMISLKRLQVRPETWEDIVQNRPAWRGEKETGAAICEANWIVPLKTKKGGFQVTRTLTPQCQQSAPSNESALPKNTLRANRSRWTPSDAIHQQFDDAKFFLHSHPCCCPFAINHRHHPLFPNPCIEHSEQLRQHHDISHSPDRWDDVRLPIACYHHHQHPHLQRCGLGPNLSSLRSHIHLIYRPGQSLVGPLDRDKRTSA
ncbi:hypothetical protein SprV_0902657500 [Sparganum proliferum]